MFTCSTLLLFPYPVPADIHGGSVQHVTLEWVPMDVLSRLFLLFSQVKHLECHHIWPPREVQCVHMYSVAWDALVSCTNHYLTEMGWRGMGWVRETGGGGGGARGCGPGVWGLCAGSCVGGAVCGRAVGGAVRGAVCG